eukprot:EC719628.1.p2 GENE.EC719628.1~~EC719628.1.p2  ORF type:complete len:114 (+),score=27.98 EC719628.1:83-424(+)
MSEQIRARHVLLKHTKSRRPVNWKNETVTRTPEEAHAAIEKIRADIVAGTISFEDAAKKYSDCSSARNGGDLGKFGRNMMHKPFEDAAFALEVNGISDIVETDSGTHIIQRIE